MAQLFARSICYPYKVIISTTQKALIEASKLYLDVISEKNCFTISIVFANEFALFDAICIRESYSYDFFKTAIVDAAIAIEDGSEENTIKAYALFFLNVAYIELGAEETFDFLLKSHSPDLL